MTTSEIVSHLGFGTEITPQTLGTLPNYIHILNHFSANSYDMIPECQEKWIKYSCNKIAN